MIELDDTHDAAARSWVESANAERTPFPVQNLPLGVFERDGRLPRVGIAIGDAIVDVPRAFELGLLPAADAFRAPCGESTLNALMALGRPASRALRRAAFDLLETGSPHRARAGDALVPAADVRMRLPARIGDFTDFFTSLHHAERGMRLNRPGAPPLFANFRSLPIAYHGRASSVVVGGTPCVRPHGQLGAPEGAGTKPPFGPTRRLDFELEVGAFVGPGNALGEPIPLADAESRLFGLCLVNDWSARDIQRWETQPLGPFLAKSFMTSVSPWVVTLEALQPFRRAHDARAVDDPPLADYLDDPHVRASGAIDIELSVSLSTATMRERGDASRRITGAAFGDQYWTLFQMLAHHASNGCNLAPGDLLASGTVSDADASRAGCLLELTEAGRTPLALPNGESRAYLADGDEVVFDGWCRRSGFRAIGFGDVRGLVVPAVAHAEPVPDARRDAACR